MKLEVRISQDAHLGTVEPFDLRLFADAEGSNKITDLEPHVRHDETEDRHYSCIDYLHDELRKIPVKQPAHAIGTIKLDHLFTDHAVPPGAVLARRKDADRQHTPDTIDTVNGDR